MEGVNSTLQSLTFVNPANPAAASFGRRSVTDAGDNSPPSKRLMRDNLNKTVPSNSPLSARDIENSDNHTNTRALIGGKGMFLSVMQQANIPVPPFKVIDTLMIAKLEQHLFPSACLLPFLPDIRKWSGESYSLKQLQTIVTKLPHQQQSEWLKGLSRFIASEDFYQQVKNTPAALEIGKRYHTLQQQSKGAACIIRSSGVEEDCFGDAQAGRFDSRVHGDGDILKTCLQVLSSAYRPQVCPGGRVKPIALIMQQCIHCQLGGVVISHSSLHDDTIQVEYAPGQPRGAVSGDSGIRPHRYTIKRKHGKYSYHFTPGDITTQFVLEKTTSGEGYIEQSTLPTTEAKNIRLAYEILKQVHGCTELLEGITLSPLDIEFGVDEQGQFHVLQCRPVTQLPGGTRFSAAAPSLPLAEGTMVSEGCSSGTALVVTEPVDVEQFPSGAIVFADHASDWMLAPEILQRAGGFVFQQGGTNDHVAITLRQAGVPCLLAGPQYAEAATNANGQQITLVAGTFADDPGAYLLKGDQTAYWQASSTTSGQDTISSPTTSTAEPPNFTRVDEVFDWLNRQNKRLLDYFHSDRLINRCLGPGRSKAVSMSANRSDLMQQLGKEISMLQEDLTLFLGGYIGFLKLAKASQPHASEVNIFLDEFAELLVDWISLKSSIDDLCTKVVMPLATDRELPAKPTNFRQWLKDCQILLDGLQKLTQPRKVRDIRSAHDLIYWLHRQFVSALAPVAEASGQGQVTEIAEGRSLINILPQGASGLLDDNCILALTKLNIAVGPNFTGLSMLNMVDIARVNAKLGVHVCTITMLEQAEGGKGRTLRIDISDNFSQDKENRFLQGKLKRSWFLVQTLRCALLDGNSRPMAISFNQGAGRMSIEYTQVNSTSALQAAFVKLVTILTGLTSMDCTIKGFNRGDNIDKWYFETLVEKCQNGLDESTNNWTFKHCLVLDAINDRGLNSLWHCDYTFLDYLDKEYKLIFEITRKVNSWVSTTEYPNNNTEQLRQIFRAATKDLEPYEAARIVKELLVHMVIETRSAKIFIQLLRKDFDLDHDRDLVLFLSRQNPLIFTHISDEHRDDIEIAKSAIKQIGMFLEDASDRLRNDKSLVMLAVDNRGEALCHASEELKDDPDVVLAASRRNFSAFAEAGPTAKNDEGLLRKIIEQNPDAMYFAAESLKNDKDFVLPLLSRKPEIYEDLGDRLKSDPDIQAVAGKKTLDSH